MSSMRATALASLDDSLAALAATMQQFEAAIPVDLVQAGDRLKAATESAHKIRAFVLSQMPEADWEDRDELCALLEAIDVQRRRSQLLALAGELERGNITHRRAARVAQLTKLRSEAAEELRSFAAAEKAPPDLPGPESDHWVQWACALKEPDDTAALRSLRAGFPRLDEFVATLEPGMWVVTAAPQMAAPAPQPEPEPEPTSASAEAAVMADDLEQRRARLLALATELERGDVVHHRAIRVTQVNQLRDQAIQELRFQALVAREPATLPGPDAEQWVAWACSLQEPDDAEALQNVRDNFAHLDEFIASLEPDMWVPAGPAQSAVLVGSAKRSPEQGQGEKSPVETPQRESAPIATPPVEAAAPKPTFTTLISSKTRGLSRFSLRLPPQLVSFWRAKWRILLPGMVLLLVVFTAMLWQLRRTHASNSPVKSAEAKAPEAVEISPSSNPVDANASAANSATHTPDVKDAKDKGAKAKDLAAATKPEPPPPPAEKQVVLLNDAALRTPQAMPKVAAVTDGSSNGDSPGSVPGALPGGVPNSLTNIARDVPAGGRSIPTPRIRVSSGVAQGQLIHEVAPIYPAQAKLAGINGTVVLQAEIGKDGSVQKVKALRGPPILIQSALAAVKQWRYKPFAVNGEPAEADVEINLKFAPYQ